MPARVSVDGSGTDAGTALTRKAALVLPAKKVQLVPPSKLPAMPAETAGDVKNQAPLKSASGMASIQYVVPAVSNGMAAEVAVTSVAPPGTVTAIVSRTAPGAPRPRRSPAERRACSRR